MSGRALQILFSVIAVALLGGPAQALPAPERPVAAAVVGSGKGFTKVAEVRRIALPFAAARFQRCAEPDTGVERSEAHAASAPLFVLHRALLR